MIKHIWTVLCRESKIEMDTNNISIIDAYENLQFNTTVDEKKHDKTKPIVGPFNFEVVSLFYRDKKGSHENLDIYVTILDPQGEKMGEFHSKAEFQDEHNRLRNRVKFNSIALTTSGTYVCQVRIEKEKSNKKEPVAAIPIDVQLTINGREI